MASQHDIIDEVNVGQPETLSEPSLLDLDSEDESVTEATSQSDEEEYSFPTLKMKRYLQDTAKVPICLVACGSFSPITYLHLRIFEMAKDYIKFSTNFELVGGYLSPVSDAYKKVGLASAEHRINMCRAAVADSKWIDVDPWEASQKEYQPTAVVLDHFNEEINVKRGGIETYCGEKRKIRIALLAGADLIQTMSTPGVWSERDLAHILGQYGAFIVERAGTDIDEALSSLQAYRDNIYVISQLVANDVSSTKIRLFLRRDMSVRYLLPPGVITYIEEKGLYQDDAASVQEKKELARAKDKGKEPMASSSAVKPDRL